MFFVKILLVEDDVLLGAALIKVLEEHGYVIDQANDGQTGLDLSISLEY
jgi:DNA-binding response OmpR family regulator